MALRLQVQRSKGLLVLGNVLSQYVPKRLGLLRAQENRLVVSDVHLLGALAQGKPEHKLKSHTLTRTCTLFA